MIVRQFLSYLGVGAVNTAVGVAAIFLFMAMSVDPKISNVLGYAIGLVTSFLLNRRLVFRSSDPGIFTQGMRFIVAFALSYGLNFMVLSTCLEADYINKYAAQVISALAYVGSFYFFSKYFVFRNRSESDEG